MLNIKVKWLITGAAFGYFVFHPLVHIISLAHFFGDKSVSTDFLSDILRAFSISMLPWSIAFMILNALIGYSWGKIKLADEEKSKVIEELQKALERVKTLSGLLPICASCKKFEMTGVTGIRLRLISRSIRRPNSVTASVRNAPENCIPNTSLK